MIFKVILRHFENPKSKPRPMTEYQTYSMAIRQDVVFFVVGNLLFKINIQLDLLSPKKNVRLGQFFQLKDQGDQGSQELVVVLLPT